MAILVRIYAAIMMINFCFSSPLVAKPYRDIERRYHVKLAYHTVKEIDYLPFSFLKDGCFARALYIGMELIAKKIPVNNQYIVGRLQPEGAQWGWHVAPMVKGPKNKEYIFDPSFAKKPMVRKKWVRFSNPIKESELWVAPISNYSKERAYELQQKQVPGYEYETMIERFSDIPEFNIKDIANACRVVYRNIGLEKLSLEEIKDKRRKLISRTKYLLHKLRDLDLLSKEEKIKSCKKGSLMSVASK